MRKGKLRRWTTRLQRKLVGSVEELGPGVITGAADDDPSGIATYSQAGAQFGYGLLWTQLLSYPLMVAIQLVSAHIGRVTGSGLAKNLIQVFPRPVVIFPGRAQFRRQARPNASQNARAMPSHHLLAVLRADFISQMLCYPILRRNLAVS
jgi:hypothetical protein